MSNPSSNGLPGIGVIGGMGPAAGLDLVDKITAQTRAHGDHDHLPVALLSYPRRIVDRSTFLFGETDVNPGHAIAEITRQLERVGASVAGMPCNTAHAPAIFDTIVGDLRQTGHQIRLLHMIDETVRFMQAHTPYVQRVGTLSTLAVYDLRLHRDPLEAAGFDVVVPDEDVKREAVNRTIFDSVFGLKAQAHPVTPKARQNLLDAIRHLRDKGADAVVLGCTELPLAPLVNGADGIDDLLLIDPADILARALIREVAPESLRPLPKHYAAFVS
jgi:aspartate racemase